LQTIHKRHLDVGDQNVGFGGLQEWQGYFAIGSFTAKFKAVGPPVNIISDTLSGHDLILNDKDFMRHAWTPFSSKEQVPSAQDSHSPTWCSDSGGKPVSRTLLGVYGASKKSEH
jgi:hypothetical protein